MLYLYLHQAIKIWRFYTPDDLKQLKRHGSASSDEAAKVVRESLGRVDLGEAIERALTGLYGERFNRMHLVESAYSHDHEEIVEDVQSYRYVTWKEW